MLKRAFGILLPLLWFSAGATIAQPQRIVSMNVCTDQWLLLLAKRERIASITWLGADPEESPLAALARGIPLNYGQSEEIIPLQPDLILAGTYTARFSVDLLQQRGFQVERIAPAESLTQLRAGMRRVAELIGASERGEALLAEFDLALAQLAPPDNLRPSVLIYAGKGYATGANSLGTDLMEAVGLSNQAAQLGLDYSTYVELESLLRQPPELLVISVYHPNAPSLATRYLQHPALLAGLSKVIELPARLLSCTPSALVQAAQQLQTARQQLLQRSD